jgi:hypothetical protein
MAPIAFSDAELDVIMNLAAPLDPLMRDAFLRAVAIELARYQSAEVGPGLVNRVGRVASPALPQRCHGKH